MKNVDEADDDFDDYQRQRARQLLIDTTNLNEEFRQSRKGRAVLFSTLLVSRFPRVFVTDD